ncbi:type IV pilus assembly protein PilM [Candidatus Falkowbacteria bacterium]|nr:type IV pilus assembly protein PilM [Candidatus Falkowbacteria bacterium]
MFFNNNSTYPLGLDISDLSLKLVQLNKNGGKVKIQAISKVNLPPGYFIDGEIKNEEEIIKAIKGLIDNPKLGKVSSREVVACLPETKTFIKLIEIEKTENKLSAAIESEIEKHIPVSINEIYYDWQVIKDLPDRKLILIGAAPKSVVKQYTDLLDAAKLSVIALEIESISICRSLLAEENFKYKGDFNKNYGIIDIGAKRTSLAVYSKNTILFTISMPISGEEITKKIAEALNIEIEQAEKAKIICGLDENKAGGIIKNILSDTIDILTKKIGEAVEFYNYHFSDRGPINEIILCGGGAKIKNLDKILSKSLLVETTVGDALTNLGEAGEKFSKILAETHRLDINISPKNKKGENKALSLTQDTSLTFTTAIGLALRAIFIDEL